ncbi:MAG: SprT family zinc-dependent metalloprotease [Nitratireductor sp.]
MRLFPAKPPAKRRLREVIADGAALPVSVVESPRARRLTLRIVPGGRALKVTIPPHVSESQVDQFIARNQNWIASRIARIPEPVEADSGAVIPYLGLDHRIIHLDRLRGVVEAREVAGEPALLVPGEPSRVTGKLATFLKTQAREQLNLAVDRHSRALGVRAKSVRITDTTSRWGSCSTTRTLSFSWRIIMAPPEVLDYLAAHEVAHLREMNHSQAFWDHVRAICPNMERHKSWLRRNGARLHSIRLD